MAEKPKPPPKRKARRKMTKAEQSERFRETARKLGADETGEAFERALDTVVPPKTKPREPAVRRLVLEMPEGTISDDGEYIDFNFVSSDGTPIALRASTDGLDVMMYNLEQLAILALKRRQDLKTDRRGAPKELPAFRSICDSFSLEPAEPEDNFEGYRLLGFRWSRPPIMLLLTRAAIQRFFSELRDAAAEMSKAPKH